MYSSTSHLEKSKCHRFVLNIHNLPIIFQGGKHFGQYFLAEVANIHSKICANLKYSAHWSSKAHFKCLHFPLSCTT